MNRAARILRHWRAPAEPVGALTIGNFDGVHLGHQQVLAETAGHARALHGAAVAVTFHPHPREVLIPQAPVRRLSRLHERLIWLLEAGMDYVLLLHFDAKLAAMPAERFIARLHEVLGFRHLHVGYDFAFGAGRKGDARLAQTLGERLGFTVSQAAPFVLDGAVVSSSRIRSAIEAADFALAKRLLGRPFVISGRVGRGDARGRLLGFPTANISLKGLVHPPPGVYAVRARTRSRQWHGAAYIGLRPTFHGQDMRLEVHLFDDHPDLYRQRLWVEFVARIREDRAFPSRAELVRQIAEDCRKAREMLESLPG
ncbi:MAG: riboflavin biosynthesis protein RibF [Zetaproteobacteria bacterium]|nr:MAG: riboflavin biosynthesis protein RibF [Zetaproteobacteria bacterium]